MLDISAFLAQEGGTATRDQLLTVMSSHRLTRAVRDRWGVLHEPEHPEIVVPAHRRVDRTRRRKVDLRYRDLGKEDVDGDITTPLRTAVDVARDLPLSESLPVVDSALRSGALTEADLAEAAADLPRTRRARARLALRLGSASAANPFESGHRTLSVEAVGERFVAQPEVELRSGQRIHPDAGCLELRVALEADSHAFHTSRSDIIGDCWRYDELTIAGWVVLRFAWEHVMKHPEWVREVIRRAVALRSGTTAGPGLQVA